MDNSRGNCYNIGYKRDILPAAQAKAHPVSFCPVFVLFAGRAAFSNSVRREAAADMHSIRARITAITVAAVLASILTLGGIGLMMIGMESDRTSVEKMSLISDKMQQRLNAYFGSIQQSVDMGIHMAEDSLDGMDIMLFSSSRSAQSASLTGIWNAAPMDALTAFGE